MLKRSLPRIAAAAFAAAAVTATAVVTLPVRAAAAPSALQDLIAGRTWRNVLGLEDTLRPLIGVRFSMGSGEAAPSLAKWKDGADFVQILPEAPLVEACEQAGIPWQGRLLLDLKDLDASAAVVESLAASPHLLSWQVEAPLAALQPAEASEKNLRMFGNWLKAQYQDLLPNADSNGDGISLNTQAELDLAAWDDLQPGHLEERPLLFRAWGAFCREQALGRVDEALQRLKEVDPSHPIILHWTGGWNPPLDASTGADALSFDLFPCSMAANPTEAGSGSGLVVERRDDRVLVAFPDPPSPVFVEWEVTLPPAARVLVEPRLEGDGGLATVRVVVYADFRPRVVWEQDLAPGEEVQVDADLSEWTGQKVRLRLEAVPRKDGMAGHEVHWGNARLRAAGQEASLLDLVNWWQARSGYRPARENDVARDVYTGSTAGVGEAGVLRRALQRAAGAEEAGGLRWVLGATHPACSTGSLSPEIWGAFWADVLAARPAVVVFAPPPGEGEFVFEAAAADVARWKRMLQMARPYEQEEQDVDWRVLYDSDDAEAPVAGERWSRGAPLSAAASVPDNVAALVYAVDADRAGLEAVFGMLEKRGSRSRTLVFLDEAELPAGRLPQGFEEWGWLVYPEAAGGQARISSFPVDGYSLGIAGRPRQVDTPEGWSVLEAADGSAAGVRRDRTLVVFGRPGPGNRDVWQRFAQEWLGGKAGPVEHRGWVHAASGRVDAGEVGLWTVDSGSVMVPGAEMGAYDLGLRRPVQREVRGPAAAVVFARHGASVVDPGTCRIISMERDETVLVAEVEVSGAVADPAAGSALGRIVFWSPERPEADLDTTGAWQVEDLGDGFRAATCGRPGRYTLRIPGARAPRVEPEWTPIDH